MRSIITGTLHSKFVFRVWVIVDVVHFRWIIHSIKCYKLDSCSKSPLPPFWERGSRSMLINVLYINGLVFMFRKWVIIEGSPPFGKGGPRGIFII
jgi:hypothetical protein